MIRTDQWQSLIYLSPADFTSPDLMGWPVVSSMDRLIHLLGVKPIIIDSYRRPDASNTDSQHPKGLAIDFTVPGVDSIRVLETVRGSKLFTGYGMYQNEINAQSFHVDRRTDRTVTDPATWGGLITRPFDPDLQRHVRKTEYVGLQAVVDLVKKNSQPVLALSVLIALGLVMMRK